MALLEEPLDVMVVVGGYNSSNTISLAALCAERVPTYHIEGAGGDRRRRRHGALPPGRCRHAEEAERGGLAARMGRCASASRPARARPNNKIGETVARLLAMRGVDAAAAGRVAPVAVAVGLTDWRCSGSAGRRRARARVVLLLPPWLPTAHAAVASTAPARGAARARRQDRLAPPRGSRVAVDERPAAPRRARRPLAADDDASYVDAPTRAATTSACRPSARALPTTSGVGPHRAAGSWRALVAARAHRARPTTACPRSVTRWQGRRLRYAFSRALTIEPDGAVRIATRCVAGDGAAPLPVVLASAAAAERRHAAGAAGGGARARVGRARHRAGRAEGAASVAGAARPTARGEADRARGSVDFTYPALAPALRDAAPYACKLFLDLPRASSAVRLAIEQDGARLEVEVDPREVPHFGLWLNHGGWTPFAGGTPYRNLAFEPCIGAPDTLDAALGAWGARHGWRRARHDAGRCAGADAARRRAADGRLTSG